jgi:hypothetical protein
MDIKEMTLEEVYDAVAQGKMSGSDFEEWVWDRRNEAISEFEYNQSMDDCGGY